jgi:hypothetical protein
MLVLKGDAPLPVRAAAILRTALRIRDLGPGDFVSVECVCGHSMLIPPSGLQQGLRLPPHLPVLDLQYRLRYRECDRRGRVVASIKWAAN